MDSHKKANASIWSSMATISLLCGCFTMYKGIDKMTRYANGDYVQINAYVGGDAYNYIINGTYATAFFVLTAMFVLSAIGLMILHYVSITKEETESKPELKTKTLIEDIESDLPAI